MLSIFNVADPRRIQQIGFLEAGYSGYGVQVSGNYAYVADGGANLHVIDFSDPSKPVEVNRIGTENFCSRVLALADFAAEKSPATAETGGQGPVTNAPPQITEAVRIAGGAFSFTLRGIPEGAYYIEASTDLAAWKNISTNTLPAEGTLRFSDPDAHLFNNRFYRAVKKE